MNSNKKSGFEFTEQQRIVVESRIRVITINRILLFVSICVSLIFIFLWNWFSALLVFVIGYTLSIVNSVMISNRARNITGLSHSEQAEIWGDVKADYKSFRDG